MFEDALLQAESNQVRLALNLNKPADFFLHNIEKK